MLSNEEYLESKNLKLYTTVDNIDQNIITDPKLIPNGLHQVKHVNSNESQKNNNNNLVEPEPLDPVPAVTNSNNSIEEEIDNKINNMVIKKEEEETKPEKVNTYASKLLADLTKNTNLKNKKPKNNNTKNLLRNSRNNMNLEIMKVFPLSLIILLLIFIILLVVCIGIN